MLREFGEKVGVGVGPSSSAPHPRVASWLAHLAAEIIWRPAISPTMCNARWTPSLWLLLVSFGLDLVSAQNTDCYAGAGGDYAGNITTTISGRSCQSWDANSPHDTSEALRHLAESGMSGHRHNFCRNWDTSQDAPWCYTADPLYKWECCAVPRCAGQPAARCPIWCCPSDYPAYLQPTLFILPPLGITLLVGATCFLCIGRRQRQEARSSAAWPERPRFRSTAGALALFGLFLSNLAGMPVLLYANDLWEPRTSNSLLLLQPVGLLFSLLLVRPTDRSVKVLVRLVAVLCFIFLLLSVVFLGLMLAHDVCVYRATTLNYWNQGCVTYSAMIALSIGSFAFTVYTYVKFRYLEPRRSQSYLVPVAETPPGAPLGRSVTTVAVREVEMQRVLLHLWGMLRFDLFVSGIFSGSFAIGRLSYVLGVNGYETGSISGEGDAASAMVSILLAIALTPTLRMRLQLGLLPRLVPPPPIRMRSDLEAVEANAESSSSKPFDGVQCKMFDGLELGESLGKGGFSHVFVGHVNHESVAIKVLKTAMSGSSDWIACLGDEFEGGCQWAHANPCEPMPALRRALCARPLIVRLLLRSQFKSRLITRTWSASSAQAWSRSTTASIRPWSWS